MLSAVLAVYSLRPTSDPDAHKSRKKLLQRGFSQASMLIFEPQINTKVETVLDQWAKRARDGPVDVYPWLHWLAFDIVCEHNPNGMSSGAINACFADSG